MMATEGSLSSAAVVVIKRRMDAAGVSGNKLSQQTGIAQTSMARLLRGLGDLTLDDLDKIARCLGTNLLGLVHEVAQEHASSC